MNIPLKAISFLSSKLHFMTTRKEIIIMKTSRAAKTKNENNSLIPSVAYSILGINQLKSSSSRLEKMFQHKLSTDSEETLTIKSLFQ